MAELLEAVASWPSLVLVVIVFGFAPGFCLRLIVLAYPRSDPRRDELIAELYAVPRIQRPLWVAQQLEVALFEGLRHRLSATHERGVRLGLTLWAARERRHLAWVTLMDELRRDTAILGDPQFAPSKGTPRPRVYPRLPVSATDAALTSGALAERSDGELLRILHNWRDEVNGFNRRLELTEIRVFTSGNPAEIAAFERALHRSDGYLNQIRRHLRDLQNYLAANYQATSKHHKKFGGSGRPGRWRLLQGAGRNTPETCRRVG